MVQAIEKEGAVGELGQRIVEGELLHLRFGLFLGGDLLHRPFGAYQLPPPTAAIGQ